MSESKNSQVQQAKDAWKKAMDDQTARVELVFGEVGRLESQALDHTRTALDEAVKMQKDTLAYFGQLSAEWRRLTIEATRKATDFLTFRS